MREKTKWTNIAKRKVFVSVIGISLLIGSCLVLSETTFAKNGVIVNPEDQTEIQSVIQEFLHGESQKQIETKEQIIEGAKEILKRPDTSSMVKGMAEGIIKGEIKVPLKINCSFNSSIENIERVEKDKINVKVREDRTCTYDDGSNTSGIYPHIFWLVKKGGEWNIERFEDGSIARGQIPESETISPLETLDPEELIKNQKIECERIKDDYKPEECKENGFQVKDIMKNRSYTYNRNNAAWYGWYYAKNPNSSFRDFTSSGGDCTNFISQSVWYGNWPMVGWWPDKYSTSVWWYSFYDWQGQSRTWTSASKWFWFTYYRPRGYLTSNCCNLQKGDIVQRDNSQDGKINMDHSLIVTDVRPGCNIRISYHTPNTQDQSLWEFMGQYPNANFYGWRLYDSGD